MLHTLTYGRNIGTQGYVTDLDWELYCQEVLDAIGLDYIQCEDDDTQNEVAISLTKDEFCDIFETIQLAKANEQVFASRILNPELGEYTTKVTVYTPQGDKITFE